MKIKNYKQMKSITVFTPTYNRAFCLEQLYISLVDQTNKDFLWLLIDDGSTDGTSDLVQTWINEKKIEIKYIFQINTGMHGAHNTAYNNIDTELNVCIDSDDFMSNIAIESILNIWNQKKTTSIAGIIGLDAFKNGKIIGDEIPENIVFSTLEDVYNKHKIKGDKKLVIRTDIVKKFPPYPIYKGEKLVPLGTLYLLIDQQYQWICSNTVLCIVEYLEEGSSKNIFKQYRISPKGFGYSRLVKIKYSKSILEKFKNAMHLVSSSLFAKDLSLLLKSSNGILTFFSVPFGVLLHLYIRYKTR